MIHLISPAYNEEESIQHFCRELAKHLPPSSRLYLVDDGSKDATFQKIEKLHAEIPIDIYAIKLSRNFGHQAAIHAGLQYAFENSKEGDCFIVLDSDLQHPPRLIPQMIKHLKSGIHHVQMIRIDEASKVSFLKRWTSSNFYRLFSWLAQVPLPKGGSDFRGFSYTFVKAYLQFQEANRFNRGLFVWMGFENLQIPYHPDPRFAGSTKYSLWRMLRLGLHGITQFSNKPLLFFHLSIAAFALLFCSIYLIVQLTLYLKGHPFEPGWPTIIFLITFWGGLLAAGNLVTSLYIALIFNEVKSRPLFFTEKEVRLSANSSASSNLTKIEN